MNNSLFRPLIPIAMALAGMALVLFVAWRSESQLGYWHALTIAGSFLVLFGVMMLAKQVLNRREPTDDEKALLASLREQINEEVSDRSSDLDRREQELANRFITLHQWLEFPQPIDLNTDTIDPVEELRDADGIVTDKALSRAELAGKDKELIALLEAESEVIFENIRTNKYSPDGKFDAFILRDDALDLIERVARIYRPDLERPFLETSLSRVVPAASRACLHFLLVLDQLPINVKDRSFNNLYGYVQRAVNTYGAYKKAKPYIPYLNSAYYLGRFAFGANPLTMGAWWFLGEVGKRSAEAVVTKVINRQALGLLHNVIRIIGYEVAGIYGGDFRHRDANWIYAVELTQLAKQFPLTSSLLAGTLKELSAVQLRCEFDRVFLYRCLAEHHSADPERYQADQFLPTDAREAIAGRLEDFAQRHVAEAISSRIHRWQYGVETRLGVKLITANTSAASEDDQVTSALRTLTSFLVNVKQLDFEEAKALVRQTSSFELATTDVVEQWNGEPAAAVIGFIARPELDPRGRIVNELFADLLKLEVSSLPRNLDTDDYIFDLAASLRQDVDKTRQRLNQAYVDALRSRSVTAVKASKLPVEVARAVLDLLGDEHQLELAVRGITYDAEIPAGKTHWLFGYDQHLIAISLTNGPRLVWRGQLSELSITKRGGIVTSECHIVGGEWLERTIADQPILRISGSVLRRFSDFIKTTPNDATTKPIED